MVERQKKSKKQSDANLPLDEKLTFFIDRSLGHKKLANKLIELGENVITHDDEFSPTTPDDEWLEKAGENGWIVLTHDTRIRYRQIEKDALITHGVKAFVLTAKQLKGDEIAETIAGAINGIKRQCYKLDGPFIASITKSSSINILYPEKKSIKSK